MAKDADAFPMQAKSRIRMRINFLCLIMIILTVKPLFFQLVTNQRMCYAQVMQPDQVLIDFHSHFPSPSAVVCTAEPCTEAPSASLMRFEGLLPDRWTAERQKVLSDILLSDSGIHMGEIGLDKRFTDLLSMERQAEILREELSFAVSNNRCVSLHCVQATGLLLQVLSELRFRPFSVIWHGFSGSAETARQLYKAGVIISIGPRFHGSIRSIFEANPHTVPETDYDGPDEAKHEAILRQQYERFCTELGMTIDDFSERAEGALRKLQGLDI